MTNLNEDFSTFHNDNPEVYRRLVSLARQAKESGHNLLSIKMLFEVVRWFHILETTDPDYKLNNNYHSRYARLIMEQEPDLAGIFNLRELKS